MLRSRPLTRGSEPTETIALIIRNLLRLLLVFAAVVSVPAAGADIGGAPSRVHALTGVRLVRGPGAEPFEGTIVVRDGRIEMLGAGVDIPADAVVHDRTGRTIYPGLIEAYLRLPAADPDAESPPAAPDAGKRAGTTHENPRMRADVRAAELLPLDADLLAEMREAGFTTAFVAPSRGVFRGTGAVVSLAEGDPADHVLDPGRAQVLVFEHGNWEDRSYPNSLMGAIALARQALHDAAWHRDAWEAWRKNGDEAERPAENLSLRALLPVIEGDMPLFIESEDLRMLPRALQVAREFRLKPVVVAGGADEYRRPERVRGWLGDADASLVVAVDFPRAPTWDDDDGEVAVELEALVHWERAPTSPRELERAGVPFAVTTQGLKKRASVFRRLRTAIRLGFSEEAALASLTTEPARILGIDERTGTLDPGKDANLVVATGDLFDPATKIEEVWIDGVRFGEDPKRATESDVRGQWDLVIGSGDDTRGLRIRLERGDEALEGRVVPPEADEAEENDEENGERPKGVPLENVELVRGMIRFDHDGTRFGLHLDGKMLRGTAEESGVVRPVVGRRPARKPEEPDDLWTILSENAPAWPPEIDPASAPRAVHVMNATLWTLGRHGVLEDMDFVAQNGRIVAIGRDLPTLKNGFVVDAKGRHVTPGLVDCHSHSSISGGVNECTNSCTSEVRIADVVNPRSQAIYRELAGGLTVSNLLHGSCNAIGGQNAVIKLRWGQPAEDLLFAEAPAGIKFALGENVKQSNWGGEHTTRYPQTRMGVEQFIRERFFAAEDYRREWEGWRKKKNGSPPRRDLQLDALIEILDGERLVHCHSYRADEIVMLIRVAEDFGFRIGTFQHVLEGYKCADEMAAHGAGASSFSDWWSYKYEVVEAIPYSGSIMWHRGVNVSFNSDSSELSRRMNLEGAKAAKYGGVPETEALAFVTRNPAIQLGIEPWVGTLESGKHADFVVWSDHPLSDRAVCEETWIDGVRRFSREEDQAARAAAMELRERLLAKARALNRIHELDATESDKGSWPGRSAFGRRWGGDLDLAEVEQGVCVAGQGDEAW